MKNFRVVIGLSNSETNRTPSSAHQGINRPCRRFRHFFVVLAPRVEVSAENSKKKFTACGMVTSVPILSRSRPDAGCVVWPHSSQSSAVRRASFQSFVSRSVLNSFQLAARCDFVPKVASRIDWASTLRLGRIAIKNWFLVVLNTSRGVVAVEPEMHFHVPIVTAPTTLCDLINRRIYFYLNLLVDTSRHGGEGGIRTHGTRKGSTVFETARFNRSRTSPGTSNLAEFGRVLQCGRL